MLSYVGDFHKNFLSVACCTFNVLEVRTITPNRFKNQSGGTSKILAHYCNHQQGLAKQKNVALHHCGFKAEFPKHLLKSLFWIKFINVAIVTQNWNNIWSNVNVSTAALLPTFLTTKNSRLSISAHFHKNSQIVTCCTFGRFEIRTLTQNRFKNQTNGTLKLLGTIYITWNIFNLKSA